MSRYDYVVVYVSSMTHEKIAKTVPANSPSHAVELTKATCSVEYIVGDPVKLKY